MLESSWFSDVFCMCFFLFGVEKSLGSCFYCDGLVTSPVNVLVTGLVPTDCFRDPQLASKTL